MISRSPFAYSSMTSQPSSEGLRFGVSSSLLGLSGGVGRDQPTPMRTALIWLKPEWAAR